MTSIDYIEGLREVSAERESYLPDSMLSWLVELLADEGAELILLAVGEGRGGSPA